ncbi:tumor susceptibility gene 101 protein-like isoform X2 [Paramacrobiotus metropolitanus]|uniref:tumor susceptibility gene 101 protein-like isoform X2 n=1 Tax=Paramacrobiotus metropolitanus TaxID=2943436 RepID=UPI00244581AD|nr:tumor susceptibility gene 101 protein-like isoform X2 [Paramacrobiotus metropolitanus]
MTTWTAKTLENMLGRKYRYPDQTAKDVHKLLSYYSDLRPSMSDYVFPDGSNKELMNLFGTLPINYKGSTYNIPVQIWLMDTHPQNPPFCYVKPTPDMKIKPNLHVDQNGRVYLPYLTDWRHNSSDLLEFCHIMAMIFGEQPPVYSKKAGEQANRNQPQPATGNPSQNFSPMPMPSLPGGGGYPAYPPAPPGAYQTPYPAFPGGYPPTGQQNTGYPPAGQYNASNRNSYPAFNPANSNGPSYPQSSPYPAYNPVADNKPSNTGTISDEHIRASLISAAEEKLGRRLNEIVMQAQMETAELSKTHDALERGRKNLDDIFDRLSKEQRAVDRNVSLLTDRTADLRTALDKGTDDGPFDIDEAVVPAAPLYKQLLNAYAEDSALEDAIYYIGEALRKNSIDFDQFLKHVRELSRRQFIQRALLLKCRNRAGLP